MFKKKLFLSTVATIAIASSLLASPKNGMANSKIIQEISKIPFIAKAGFSIKKVADEGDVWAVKASHPRIPNLTLFVAKDKKTVIVGNGFNAKTGKAIQFLTNMKQFSKDAQYTIGNGSKNYYLFTDPECPFCRAMEKNLVNLKKDIKLHVFLLPLTKIHPDAVAMTKYILTKQPNERAAAIEAIAKGDKSYKKQKYTLDENKKLSAMIKRSTDLAVKIGVRGTPTVYAEDGSNISWPTILSKPPKIR